MYSINNSPRAPRKKLFVVFILLVLLLIASGGVLYKYRINRNSTAPAAETNPPGTEKLDLSPATKTDQQQADQHKEDLIKKEEQQSPAPAEGNSVKPTIISASYSNSKVTVRSFIPGIVEDNGTCTLTLTQGSQKVTKQGPAVRNAQTTDCAPLSVERSEIPSSGTWKATIAYKSAVSSGTSDEKSVEVQ